MISIITLPLLLGCDGGTIARRSEIVKTHKETESVDKEANLSAKWQICKLSGLKLRHPIVSCGLGRLYNKDLLLEHLLNKKLNDHHGKTGASSSSNDNVQSDTDNNIVAHIKSLRDVVTLKFKTNDLESKDDEHDIKLTRFVCPISGLEMNGRYKFCFLWSCGCVMSERAIREVTSNTCLICSSPYDPNIDVVTLNPPSDADIQENTSRMSKRKAFLKRTRQVAKQQANNVEEPLKKLVKTQ